MLPKSRTDDIPDPEPLAAIETWFKGRCDGLWENQSGLTLTTTDNPGWLMTIDEAIDELAFNDLTAKVRKKWGAECLREQEKMPGQVNLWVVSGSGSLPRL